MTAKKTINEYRKLVPEQLAAECDLEYELFTAYCFLGIGDTRKLVKLVPYLVETEGLPEDGLEKYVSKIKACSSKFKWRERAKNFDFRRVVAHTDKLIVEQAKIENDWVEKNKETKLILQSVLADTVKVKEANALLVDAAISRLQGEPKIDVLVALNKIISGVVSTNFTLCRILSATWEVKDNQESINILHNSLLEFAESEQF